MSLIEIEEYPVKQVIDLLLKDKTTKKNIIFATEAYSEFGINYGIKSHITIENLYIGQKCIIQPRVSKSLEEQSQRTRKNAEVFTPSWICNRMNNNCDDEWFGVKGVFNTECENGWIVNANKIPFRDDKDWKKYVDSKRLEITCGEAPYIVSRYDAATGEIISVGERIGILDRKIRVINENVDNEDEWVKWVYRAYQSVYGYEFQGDNLLIARINLLVSLVDYMLDRWNRKPTDDEIKKFTNVIVWNLWQMDGISGTIPFGTPSEEFYQMSFFDFIEGTDDKKEEPVNCKIYDWRSNESVEYRSLRKV